MKRTDFEIDAPMGLQARQEEAFGRINTVKRDCPSCGATNGEVPPSEYSLDEWIVKQCAECSLTYLTVAPVYDALAVQMSWEKSSQLEAVWRQETRKLQQSISKRTRWRLHVFPRRSMAALLERFAGPGHVVDLGCSEGKVLEGLPEHHVPFGIEISSEAANKAHDRFSARGGACINAPALEGLSQFPDGFFSGASLRSYLEHELHPVDVLTELHRTLADGGVAIVKVPNFDSMNRRIMGSKWCGFRHPDHLNYFTPSTLADTARRVGFRTWFGPGWRLPTSDNMWALLKKSALIVSLALVSLLHSQRETLQTVVAI